MSISKNWKAITFSGAAGYEIKVNGEANVGLLTVQPKLEKRPMPGLNASILQLNLLNANDAKPEEFKPVQYNEKLTKMDQYASVNIFHNNKVIADFRVTQQQAATASL
jgi:hypothetical protein